MTGNVGDQDPDLVGGDPHDVVIVSPHMAACFVVSRKAQATRGGHGPGQDEALHLGRAGQFLIEFIPALPHLAFQAPDGKMIRHTRQDLVRLNRLCNVIDGTEMETRYLVFNFAQSRKEDYRDIPHRRIRLYRPANTEAIEIRHHDVEQNQVWMSSMSDLE